MRHVIKETFKINHDYNFSSKCLLYLQSCKECGRPYVGLVNKRFRLLSRHKKCPHSEYFPAFGPNTERYGVFLHIQSESGKIQTRKTPNTDTFHVVYGITMKIIKEKLNDERNKNLFINIS